jgi:hypothetical protein
MDASEWVPGLRVFPFLAETLTYQSNIFHVSSRPESDVIVRTSPGVLVEYGKAANALSLGYRVEVLNFLRHPDRDALHHVLAGQLLYEIGRWRLRIRDDFLKTTDPQSTELTGRIPSTTNTLGSGLEYRLTDRFALGASATWIHVDVPSLEQLTRDEYLFGVSVFRRIREGADLELNYSYGRKDFRDTSLLNVDRNIVAVGLRGDLTSKLASTFRVGYEIRQPREPGVRGYQGIIMGGEWIYRPMDRWLVSLQTVRGAVESVFGGQPFYVETGGSLVVSHRFSPKLTAALRFTAADDRYPGKETVDGQAKFRHDTLLGWGAGIGYDVRRWLRWGVEFTRTSRDSNIRQFKYQDDNIVGAVTLQL